MWDEAKKECLGTWFQSAAMRDRGLVFRLRCCSLHFHGGFGCPTTAPTTMPKKAPPLLLIDFAHGRLRSTESLYSLCGIEANMRVGVCSNLQIRETTVVPEERERSQAIGRDECRFSCAFDISKISIDHTRLYDGYRKNDHGESEKKGENEPDTAT